jgi:biopolymer transport protein ExbD
VYVSPEGKFYANGESVPIEQLHAKLSKELGKRVVWTVYVEADDDVEFSRVVYVFSTVKELGAELYWITPRMREEWNKQSRR